VTEVSAAPETLPQELADALASERRALGGVAGTVLYFSTVGSTNDVAVKLPCQDRMKVSW
jgi:hypothetical protein